MHKVINPDVLRSALTEHGLTQKELAKTIGVSSQAITNWIQGKDFPRPPKLLKLATAVQLNYEDLVMTPGIREPVIAFRRKGSAKTTATHISRAKHIGMLLKPLVPYLPELQTLRTLVTSPTTEYGKLQTIVSQTRERLGVGELAVLGYEPLISEFKDTGAILVPVLWGEIKNHENALHIRLPEEDVTFVYLNLDTRLEDFKFWMAHELAHVYTPALAGSNAGEDFADAFAGALLFPRPCAEQACSELQQVASGKEIQVLQKYAKNHQISLYTVYKQIKMLAEANSLCNPKINEKTIHAVRNSERGKLVSESLLSPLPPEPERYIATCEKLFHSGFFSALKQMLHEHDTGASYIQQILNTSKRDAMALYEELGH